MKQVRTALSYVAVACVAAAAGAMLFNLLPQDAAKAERPNPETRLVQTLNGDENLNISVLGDSTGDGAEEWVTLWAMLLAADGATVHVHTWNHQASDWTEEPLRFGSGSRSITLWNGSVPGSTPAYPIGFKDLLQPVKPDAVIVNYGHDHGGSAGSLRTEMTNLLDTAANRWGDEIPTLVTVQNPGQGSKALTAAEGQHAIRQVARQRDLPVVDVNEAFHSVGNVQTLMADEVRPSPKGSMVWASAVDDFFEG